MRDTMKCDVAIVGAGPAGLAFARSLAPAGLNIVVLEKQAEEQITNPKFDGRDIALTHLSVRLLKDLGIWERMPEEERLVIRSARVINGTSPYTLDFDTGATAPGVLGYMVSNHIIRKALIGEVRSVANVEIRTSVKVESFASGAGAVEVALSGDNGLEARLLVAADSRYSETRRMAGIPASMHDFGRVCIVSRMTHERPHDSTAFECFHYERTLAVLPLLFAF